jgi:hypothetical protein
MMSESESESTKDGLLEVEIISTTFFKSLFEFLNDILNNPTMQFISPNKNSYCIKISAVDQAKRILFKLILEKPLFSKYICNNDELFLGINLTDIYNFIESVELNDVLSFRFLNTFPDYLNIKIDGNNNPTEQIHSEFNMKLYKPNTDKLEIPPIQYDTTITMDSQEFVKLCKEIENEIEHIVPSHTCVTISFQNDKLTFNANSNNVNMIKSNIKIIYADNTKHTSIEKVTNYGSITTTRKKNINDICFTSNIPDQLIKHTVGLDELLLFTKCVPVCNNVILYMKNNLPLTIIFPLVENFGKAIVCISPF